MAAAGSTRCMQYESHLLGLVADSVPHTVQLAAHNVIKTFEEALLQGELASINFIRLAQLFDAGVHQIRYGVIDRCHGRGKVQGQLHQLQMQQGSAYTVFAALTKA